MDKKSVLNDVVISMPWQCMFAFSMCMIQSLWFWLTLCQPASLILIMDRLSAPQGNWQFCNENLGICLFNVYGHTLQGRQFVSVVTETTLAEEFDATRSVSTHRRNSIKTSLCSLQLTYYKRLNTRHVPKWFSTESESENSRFWGQVMLIFLQVET